MSEQVRIAGWTEEFTAAHIDNRLWNGFVCPFFTKEEADKVAAWSNGLAAEFPESAETITYDEEADAYIGTHPDWSDDEAARYEPVHGIGNTVLYPIGAWAWTWERAQ